MIPRKHNRVGSDLGSLEKASFIMYPAAPCSTEGYTADQDRLSPEESMAPERTVRSKLIDVRGSQ